MSDALHILAVNEGLGVGAGSSVGQVIVHARKLVAFFNKLTAGMLALKAHQKKINPDAKPLHFISDVETRWNSTYYMFERLLLLRAAFCAVVHMQPSLNKGLLSLELKDSDWTVIELLLPVFKPLVSATEVLCTEDYPTCSAIIPLTFGLLTKHLAPSEMDTGIVIDFKERVANGLRSRVLTGEYWVSIPMIVHCPRPKVQESEVSL